MDRSVALIHMTLLAVLRKRSPSSGNSFAAQQHGGHQVPGGGGHGGGAAMGVGESSSLLDPVTNTARLLAAEYGAVCEATAHNKGLLEASLALRRAQAAQEAQAQEQQEAQAQAPAEAGQVQAQEGQAAAMERQEAQQRRLQAEERDEEERPAGGNTGSSGGGCGSSSGLQGGGTGPSAAAAASGDWASGDAAAASPAAAHQAAAPCSPLPPQLRLGGLTLADRPAASASSPPPMAASCLPFQGRLPNQLQAPLSEDGAASCLGLGPATPAAKSHLGPGPASTEGTTPSSCLLNASSTAPALVALAAPQGAPHPLHPLRPPGGSCTDSAAATADTHRNCASQPHYWPPETGQLGVPAGAAAPRSNGNGDGSPAPQQSEPRPQQPAALLPMAVSAAGTTATVAGPSIPPVGSSAVLTEDDEDDAELLQGGYKYPDYPLRRVGGGSDAEEDSEGGEDDDGYLRQGGFGDGSMAETATMDEGTEEEPEHSSNVGGMPGSPLRFPRYVGAAATAATHSYSPTALSSQAGGAVNGGRSGGGSAAAGGNGSGEAPPAGMQAIGSGGLMRSVNGLAAIAENVGSSAAAPLPYPRRAAAAASSSEQLQRQRRRRAWGDVR